MIDYISVTLPLPHKPLPADRLLSISHEGERKWESPQSLAVSGSYESKLFLRSRGALDEQGRATELYLQGNPAKFLQGHNVFGHDDLIPMLKAVLQLVSSTLDLGDIRFSSSLIALGDVSRIDFTKSIQFNSRDEARAYIREISLRAKTRSGRPTAKGWTCTFQKSSRRWSIVVYSKGDELFAHKLPEDLPHRDVVECEADKLARVELRLKTLELKSLEARKVGQLTAEKLHELYSDYIGRIEMTEQVTLLSEELLNLKRCYRDTYMMWREGVDVKSAMSHDTFYRHRRELLNYGVDISVPRQTDTSAEIIPIRRILQGKAYQTPAIAYELGLIFQPGRVA